MKSRSGCENDRRIEDGTGAEACISGFVGICPRSLVVAAGGLQAGIRSGAGYTTIGADMDQQAGPCGTITFKTYTNPAALVQVKSRSGCANYRRIEDGTCAEACVSGFVGLCPRSLVGSGSFEPFLAGSRCPPILQLTRRFVFDAEADWNDKAED